MRFRHATRFGLALLLCAAAGGPARAGGADALSVEVYDDLGACARLAFDSPTTGTGVFAGAGYVTGPGTATAPAGGVRHIVVNASNGWYGCLPGAYAGASTGYATYALTWHTGYEDMVWSTTCTVSGGTVTCQ